jgi:hypothetical protein
MCSIKEEGLAQRVIWGEHAWYYTIQQYLAPSHAERKHQAHLPSPFCRKANNFHGLVAFWLSCVATIKSVYVKLCCGKVILVSGPCADVRQANAATALAQKQAAAR